MTLPIPPGQLAERELQLRRVIAAPRARVFATWVNQLPEWWGPHGTTTRVQALELRPGGAFRTTLRTADGREFATRGIFLEVVVPERIVFTDAFEPGWRPHPDAFFTACCTFESPARGVTRYTIRAMHWTVENRVRHERMGFAQGWGESIDRLVACVGRPAAA